MTALSKPQSAAFGKDSPFAEDLFLHGFFERQAGLQPEATALCFLADDLNVVAKSYTYGELNGRANRLAHYLISKGIGTESFVGIALPRSLEMVVALIAVHKAGAAYVSMDPGYPEARFRFIAEDTSCAMILTEGHIAERLPELEGTSIELLDQNRNRFMAHPFENPTDENRIRPLQPENLALMVYTSGSTGNPKGVQITYGSLVNTIRSDYPVLSPQHGDRTLHMASINFGAATIHLFRALTTGATAYLVRDIGSLGAEVGPVIRTHRLTHAFLTGSMLAILPKDDYAHLRVITVGAEKVPPDVMARWKNCLYNVYASTETTMVATCRLAGIDGDRFPIGEAVPGVEVLIDISPDNPSEKGELCVAGPGLARGYWRAPRLTAQKFTPHPHSQEPGARLYRTGDLGSYEDGYGFECLARIDHLVKIRGHRVEPGEIEAVLARHSDVDNCAVLAPQSDRGVRVLVAHVVLAAGCKPSPEQLRMHMAQSLPEYMVPSAFCFSESFPLTANGKLDRHALLARSEQEILAVEEVAYRAPTTELEQILCRVWADVLKRPQVGLDHHFFRMGGDSLLANRLVAKAGERLIRAIPVRDLFLYPTVGELANHLDADEGAFPPLKAVARTRVMVASNAQKRMWFLHQMAPGAYNIPLKITLNGQLNLDALAEAANMLLARHEPLRTSFVVEDDMPVQMIHENVAIALNVVDLSAHAAATQAERAENQNRQEAAHHFDLSHAPLLRITVLRLAETHHVLLFNLHHIVGDATTIRVLLGELSHFYDVALKRTTKELPELALQYADYAAWEGQYTQSQEIIESLGWWRSYLADIPKLLPLTTDYPRPAVQDYRGSVLPFFLPATLVARLEATARHHNVTPFMLYRVAFALLLGRYSDCDDVVIGVPAALRDRPETQQMVGFLVDTYAARHNLSGDPTFAKLLADVHDDNHALFTHQHVPFQEVVEATDAPRDTAHTPIFQVLFVMQSLPADMALANLKSEVEPLASYTSRFDFTLYFSGKEGGIAAKLEYASTLYQRRTVEGMARQFLHLLESIAVDENQPISHLDILSKKERERLLFSFNPKEEPSLDVPLHHFFKQVSVIHPHNSALVFGDTELDYEALRNQVHQMGHYLAGKGVGMGTRVGILLPRSQYLPIVLLAVVSAGGTYVPLDPYYPEERISYSLQDANCSLVITQGDYIPDLRDMEPSPTVLDLQACLPQIQQCSQAPLKGKPFRDQLAYIIYTSGSTGKPKGVQISHGAASNFIQAMINTLNLHSKTRLLAVTTVAFDIALLEMFLPLSIGAKLVVAPREDTINGTALAQLIEVQKINCMQATPITWRLLLESGWDGRPDFTALCGGEAFPPELAQNMRRLGLNIYNMYGPTEATVWASAQKVDPPALGQSAEPLGAPLRNTRFYILDRRGQPVPEGVPGALYIAGNCLAQGYQNQSALTAAHFLPDGLQRDILGERMYFSGDLVRRLNDGRIAFMGRLDHQVKVRGFRIELGEVESLLAQHPAILEAVVVTWQDTSGQSLLTAWLRSNRDVAKADAPVLRAYLNKHLPDYMIPVSFDYLEQYPLTANGKIHRSILSQRQPAGLIGASEVERDWTNTETRLVAIWEEILSRSGIGIHDNFFALGGHSLMAVRLFAEIENQFGLELDLPLLFQNPTVAGLAKDIDNEGQSERGAAVVPLKKGGLKTPLFCICGLFLYRDLALQLNEDVPVYGVYIPAEVDLIKDATGIDRFPSMEEMAEAYLPQIRKVQPNGPYRLAGVSYGGLLAYEIARQLREEGEVVELIAMFDTILNRGLKKKRIAWFATQARRIIKGGPGYAMQRLGRRLRRIKKMREAKEGHIEQDVVMEGDQPLLDFPMMRGQIYRWASDRYQPQPAPGRLLLYRAQDLELPEWYEVDQNLGWKDLAMDGLTQEWVPGDHLTMMAQPHVSILAKRLQLQLDTLDESLKSS